MIDGKTTAAKFAIYEVIFSGGVGAYIRSWNKKGGFKTRLLRTKYNFTSHPAERGYFNVSTSYPAPFQAKMPPGYL